MTGFRRTIDVTMWGAFYCLRAAANQMISQGQGGSMVVVSSIHAVKAFPTSMAYNMAKAAVDQIARTAALELAAMTARAGGRTIAISLVRDLLPVQAYPHRRLHAQRDKADDER